MSGYPLMSVLRLRRREEEAALGRLADATRVRTDAEAQEARQISEVCAARQRLEWRRSLGPNNRCCRGRRRAHRDQRRGAWRTV